MTVGGGFWDGVGLLTLSFAATALATWGIALAGARVAGPSRLQAGRATAALLLGVGLWCTFEATLVPPVLGFYLAVAGFGFGLLTLLPRSPFTSVPSTRRA